MKPPKHITGVIYDIDDTLLTNQPTPDPLSNLHQVSRLTALRTFANKYGGDYVQLLDVQPQENYDCMAASPVHTVSGAFYTLLKNRGFLSGDMDPNHPLIVELVTLKNEEYSKLLPTHGHAIEGADLFVRDFSDHYNLTNHNAVASSGRLEDIKTFLAMANIDTLFPDERIIDITKVTQPKPHREAFDRAFLSLNLPESARMSTIAFEDDPRGIASAREAGLFVCAITTRYPREFLESLKIGPHLIADSYAEFREHFGLPL